jgi:molecular chaperone DnaJ
MNDPYQVLGLDKTATDEQIKKAYRRLAKTYHPDVNKEPGAEDLFKQIQSAYETIGDPQKRQNFDRFGSIGGQVNSSHFSDAFADIFNNFGFNFGNGVQMTEVGALVISLEECISGCKKRFELNSTSKCPSCHGCGAAERTICQHCGGKGTRNVRQGPFSIQTHCSQCRGAGSFKVRDCGNCFGTGHVAGPTEGIELDIPAGSLTGTRLIIKRTNREELFVTVMVQPHPVFRISEYDLVIEREITYPQLVLGSIIEVPTVFGIAKVTVAPGTNARANLRLRGEGIPHPRNPSRRGDLIIGLNLVVPQNITEEQRQLYEKLNTLESAK